MQPPDHPPAGDPDAALKELPLAPESENAVFDVFLSHNSIDKVQVRLLAEALRDRGFRPWLDEDDLAPGRRWQEEIEGILSTIPAAAVLVGADGLGPWEIPEMRACLSQMAARNIPVIPVLLPGAPEKPKLPLFLREITWVDFRGGLTEKGLDRLIWGFTGKRLRTRRDLPGKQKIISARAEYSFGWWATILSLSLYLCIWSWFFMGWPSIVGLTATGVVGAIASVAIFLLLQQHSEARESLRQKINKSFLWNRLTPHVITGLFLIGVLLTACVGSVWLVATRDVDRVPRNVKFYSPGSESSPQAIRGPLSSRKQAKFPLWTRPFGARRYWIEVSDLPPILEDVRAYGILKLEVPDEFFSRPAILVRPVPRVSNTVNAASDKFGLRVTIGRERFFSGYEGRSIWIGVPAIAIPTKLHRLWKNEVADPAVEQRWFEPMTVAPWRLLIPGERVSVEILKKECASYRPPLPKGCEPYSSNSTEVLRLDSPYQFPQVLKLNES